MVGAELVLDLELAHGICSLDNLKLQYSTLPRV